MRITANIIFWLSFILHFLHVVSSTLANNSVQINGESLFDNSKTTTPINVDNLLFISTLNGQLIAVDAKDGRTIWTIQEGPTLKMSKTEERGVLFLASPIDGSLYSFRLGSEGFIKLPFTIPDLVSASPSRGEDGALYTGHKKDSWISVDLLTGNKHQLLDSEGIHEICPSSTPTTIFIGKTDYSVNLFDKNSQKIIWNATFSHYTSHLSIDTSSFGLKHFASSSDGYLVTMDAETGGVTWTQQFDSPIVGIYSMSGDGAFISRPFYSMGLETLEHLSEKGLVGSEWVDKFSLTERFKDSFLPTLYVGRYGLSTYALNSFVDASLVPVWPKNFGMLLLEGPKNIKDTSTGSEENCKTPTSNGNALLKLKTKEAFLIGHHDVPHDPSKYIFNPPLSMLEDKSRHVNVVNNLSNTNEAYVFTNKSSSQINNQTFDFFFHIFLSEKFFHIFIFTIIIVLLVTLVLQNKKHNSRTNNALQVTSSIPTSTEDEDGTFTVGKITYHRNDILGKGCQGTIVFKGRFEGRDVAVKRVLSEFVDIARTEIDLLQMSDHHHNVIRYFCTEKDRQFFYIALELCPLTLHEFIQQKVKDSLVLKEALRQMLAGIQHLHSLNIVHRDIKPQNVLLSGIKDNDKFLVKISDFGLCRRITQDHSYYSKSGAVGTVGWIAPEVNDNQCYKASKAVDIFSSGLVIFYVLSGGEHPFGESVMRQINITEGKYDFQLLKGYHDNYTAQDIIKKMISMKPSERPNIAKVQNHPALWSNEKVLKFLELISDRLEKLQSTDSLVANLNKFPNKVVKSDWTKVIPHGLLSDVKKFRSYAGTSIKDLLRLIRNKRHHYQELLPEVQKEVGTVPDEFMTYFIKKFPALVLHAHKSMESVKDEHQFVPYY